MTMAAHSDTDRRIHPESMASPWTDKKVVLLKCLWLAGASYSQIAMRLGDEFSRNSVSSKVGRLELPARGTNRGKRADKAAALAESSVVVEAKPVPAPPPRRLRPPVQTPEPARGPERVELPWEPPGLRTVVSIEQHECHWPIGEPESPDFTLCGRPAQAHSSYCQDHHARAWRPAPKGEFW